MLNCITKFFFGSAKRRKVSIIVTLLLLVAAVPASVLAAPPSPLLPASNIAEVQAQQFWLVMGIGAVVFVLVEALLIYAIVRYRRRGPNDMPKQVHGNAAYEIGWTVVPAIITLGLFGVSLRGIQVEGDVPTDATVIRAIGYRWYWEFDYVENGVSRLSLTEDMYVPADEPVIIEIEGADVIHSFWVPELGGKHDAVPGKVNIFWFEAEEGVYAGQCAEFCGAEHYNMLFDVHVVPRDEYEDQMALYIEEDSQFIPVGTDFENPQPDGFLPPGNAATGESLYFGDLNCQSCHSIDGTALVGPTMLGIAERSETRKPDLTAEQYLYESIALPCEYLVSGFQCVMPQTYATEQMDAQDMADVIAYLLTLSE